MLGTDKHRWVLRLGWIWNKAGSLLRALCKIQRGSLGRASKWPNSLPKPQRNEKKKITFGPTNTGKNWISTLVLLPAVQPHGLPCEGHSAPPAKLGRISKISIHWAAEQSQPISNKESTVENKIPFVLQKGFQNPLCRGRAERGSSENCAGQGEIGNPQQSRGAFQRETRSSLEHGKGAGCASLALPPGQGWDKAQPLPQTGK